MEYATINPDVSLNAFVKCYWTLETPKETIPEKQRIVPDGCMEMIFHLGDLYKQYIENEKFIIQPRSFVFGQITRALDIEATGITSIFSVRFYPEGFIPFASIPLKQLENRAVPLIELFGKAGTQLEKSMLMAANNQDRVAIIEAFLLNNLTTPESVNRVIKSGVEAIINFNGQLSVDQLSKELKINRRQLERKFSKIIGLSPKQLSKIIRLQATLKMLIDNQFTSLTSLAFEGDYYDQAHFIKDFKEFTGKSPKSFFADNLKMSSLFIE